MHQRSETTRQPAPDPAQRGAAPLSAESKRRVRLAEHQRKGFESAWNEYFDCYASTTYVAEPIVRLEDIAYHLYLKKNINPTNPSWELPSFRQLKRILNLSQDKLQGIEARLAAARLLVKDSGKGKGAKGENVANDYLLYEPLELADFLLAVERGDLPGTLNEKGQRRLADIRARFCEVGSRKSEVGSRAGEAGASPESYCLPSIILPTSDFRLPTSPVPAPGTPPAPPAGTPPAPEIGTPAVPTVRTAPAPETGTDNTRPRTPLVQQTMQQHPLPAAASRPTLDTVIVVDRDEALARGQAAIPDLLVARGITLHIARRLHATYPPERIERQVATYDALRAAAPADPKLTPGRLRRQIEEDWAAPADLPAPAAPSAAAPSGEGAGDAVVRRLAAAAAERAARLAALGLTEDDQRAWARIAQAVPVLPPPFRAALFHAPQGDAPAALIFADAAERDRAIGPAHATTRARIAQRLAAACGRPAVPLTYVAYADLQALLHPAAPPAE